MKWADCHPRNITPVHDTGGSKTVRFLNAAHLIDPNGMNMACGNECDMIPLTNRTGAKKALPRSQNSAVLTQAQCVIHTGCYRDNIFPVS